MSELEQALAGSNDALSLYLETVSIRDFREHIKDLIKKHETCDAKSIKLKIKAAIDNL